LLCLEPYKNPKTTKLNLKTTKKEGDGNKLPLHFSLEHHHRRRQHYRAIIFFSDTEKKAMASSGFSFAQT